MHYLIAARARSGKVESGLPSDRATKERLERATMVSCSI
jgi:hypothetical protein